MSAFTVKQKFGKEAEKIFKEKDIIASDDILLNPNIVSAYLFTSGKIEPILKEDYIDWETFGKVSDLLSTVYSRILEVSRILEGKKESENGG